MSRRTDTKSLWRTGLRKPYRPTHDDREFIALVMDYARLGGFGPAALPSIFTSFEPPPIFVAYPELEDEVPSHEDHRRDRAHPSESDALIRRNPQRGRPEALTIDELLGCYRPERQEIVLYALGIAWLTRERRFRDKLPSHVKLYPEPVVESTVRSIVLVHEIAHWVSHLLPKASTPTWPTNLFVLAEPEVHEGWAQLVTWWVVSDVLGVMREIFDALNQLQPSAYRVYQEFKDKRPSSAMASLERLRQLPWPARLEDWKRCFPAVP